jgi:hypothetical protein
MSRRAGFASRRGGTLALAAVLALSGCSGDDDGAPRAAGSASPQPTAGPAEQLTAEVLEAADAPDPLATGSGTLPGTGAAVTVDVLEVKAGPDTTLLRWQLRSSDGSTVETYTSALSRPNRFDIRAVALVDEQGGQRLQPFTFVPQKRDEDVLCACSELPNSVGAAGVTLYALYPALDPATTSVDVVVPGLPTLEDVEVSR